MDKELLIRYFDGQCSPQQEREIQQWAEQSSDNMKELLQMKNLYVMSGVPDTPASDTQYQDFKRCLSKKEGSHISLKPLKLFQYGIAATIIILLALNLSYNWIKVNQKEPTVRLYALEDEMVNTIYTVKGSKAHVVLPDGTKVTLNSDSKISYPTTFSGASREVEFSGEGFFEVVKDSLFPMIIRCNKGFRVEVYGTSFNLKSYDNDDNAQATLYSGSIKLVEEKIGNEKVVILKPNESYIVTSDSKLKEVQVNNITDISAWKEGRIIFNSTPMPEAVKILERWHGTKFILDSDYVRNLTVTAVLESESVVQILELLKFSTDLEYSIRADNTIVIR